jgi:Tol biopolymer transport system component
MKSWYYVIAFAAAAELALLSPASPAAAEASPDAEKRNEISAPEAVETLFEPGPAYADYTPDDLLVKKDGVKRAENLFVFKTTTINVIRGVRYHDIRGVRYYDEVLNVCTTDGAKAASFLIPGVDPVFSPDGTKIAFSSDVEDLARFGVPGFTGAAKKTRDLLDGYYNIGEDIFVMNVDGSNVTRLTFAEGLDYDPAFSPDGTKIAFVSGRGAKNDIFIMNADGSGQRRLTPQWFNDYSPAFSPDGRKIVFYSLRHRDVEEEGEISVINADGSELRQLTYNDFSDCWPCFFPDGSSILYVSGDPQDLCVMNADGSSPRKIRGVGLISSRPRISPDGSWIAYTFRPPDTEYSTQVMRTDGSDAHIVWDCYDPSYSPMRVDGVLLDTYGRVIEE